MNYEKLYTKYKFNAQELYVLTKLKKTDPKNLEDMLDKMTYNERKALFFLMNSFIMAMGEKSVSRNNILNNPAGIQRPKIR